MKREGEQRGLRFTRRALALAAGGGVLRAQPREGAPADELAAARERAARNRQELAQTPLPVHVEPAFRFEP
jgi:hypothetical protein